MILDEDHQARLDEFKAGIYTGACAVLFLDIIGYCLWLILR